MLSKPYYLPCAVMMLAAGAALAAQHAGATVAPAPTATTTPMSPDTATPTTVDADPALWVVKDADTTIYLFGTVHVLKPGLSWFDEAVKSAFERSGELRLEMVLPPTAVAQAVAMKAGTTTIGPTLPQRLAPRTRAKYYATLAQFGLPAAALDRFQPWFAANNLTILPVLKMGYALDSGAEQVLTRAAAETGKPVSGFETLNEQLGFFASLSRRAQLSYLSGVLDDIGEVGPTLNAMVREWSKGDPVALAKLLNEDLDRNPELARTLLTLRNVRWANWIAQRMHQPGTVFIAVGAGHLAGRNSVQVQLAAKGIPVERVAY